MSNTCYFNTSGYNSNYNSNYNSCYNPGYNPCCNPCCPVVNSCSIPAPIVITIPCNTIPCVVTIPNPNAGGCCGCCYPYC